MSLVSKIVTACSSGHKSNLLEYRKEIYVQFIYMFLIKQEDERNFTRFLCLHKSYIPDAQLLCISCGRWQNSMIKCGEVECEVLQLLVSFSALKYIAVNMHFKSHNIEDNVNKKYKSKPQADILSFNHI